MKKFEIENHEPSFLPEGKNWKLVWSDEFDGNVLDENKWGYRLNFGGRPFEGYTDKGIVLKNGCVELHRTEKNGCYISPQLQTGSNSFDVPKDAQGNPWGQDEIGDWANYPPRNLNTVTGIMRRVVNFKKNQMLCGVLFGCSLRLLVLHTIPLGAVLKTILWNISIRTARLRAIFLAVTESSIQRKVE